MIEDNNQPRFGGNTMKLNSGQIVLGMEKKKAEGVKKEETRISI